MCTAGAAMAIQGAGAISSGFSSYYGDVASQEEKAAGSVRKQGEQSATLAENAGLEKTKLLNRNVAEVEGAQAAGAGANVGGGSVTTADIAKDTFNKSKMDQMAIKYNADIEAWKSTNDANLKAYEMEQEAAGQRLAGTAAKKAGKIGMFNDLLSGAGQVASTWYLNKLYGTSKMPGNATIKTGGKYKNVMTAPPDYWKNQ
jgi:hypothetical protein